MGNLLKNIWNGGRKKNGRAERLDCWRGRRFRQVGVCPNLRRAQQKKTKPNQITAESRGDEGGMTAPACL
jgi:hypothetical protein